MTERTWNTSRRRFMGATLGLGVGLLGSPFVRQMEDVTVIGLGGEVQGWQGRQPDPIADQTNPTLNLVEGKAYVVIWENLDGQPHNFVIRNSNGDQLPVLTALQNDTAADNVSAGEYMDGNLTLNDETAANVTGDGMQDGGMGTAIMATEIMSTQGNVQTLSFRATSEMNDYLCTIHPNTMVGDISVGKEGL